MKAIIQKAAIATTFFASSISAQEQYRIVPSSVALATRQFWCNDQTSQCPLICLTSGSEGYPRTNDCNAQQLTYACICDNGSTPNMTEYSLTLPYYVCTEWTSQCVSNCGQANNDCASSCREDHPCGARNPTPQNTSTLSRTMSQTASASGPAVTTDASGVTLYSGFGGGGASSTGGGEESKAAHVSVWAASVGQTFGTLTVVGMGVLGFAVFL